MNNCSTKAELNETCVDNCDPLEECTRLWFMLDHLKIVWRTGCLQKYDTVNYLSLDLTIVAMANGHDNYSRHPSESRT